MRRRSSWSLSDSATRALQPASRDASRRDRRAKTDSPSVGGWRCSFHQRRASFPRKRSCSRPSSPNAARRGGRAASSNSLRHRSEEHTSELQSRENIVCRLLLEKKNHIAYVHSSMAQAPAGILLHLHIVGNGA